MLMSWTDANPGRRFYKCEEHGFVIWADDEKPGGWQKETCWRREIRSDDTDRTSTASTCLYEKQESNWFVSVLFAWQLKLYLMLLITRSSKKSF
ncbi:hypothetical protein YC2023_089446 [Brassica napus]